MQNRPLVSIVMTVYNAEIFLVETINSILSQSFRQIELIIIDDGSTDKSIEVISGFTDKRIIFIAKEHQNYVDLLNYGVSISKGDYIVKMDNDDIMVPERIQKQYDFMEMYSDIDICGSWAITFDHGSNLIQTMANHDEIVSAMIIQNPIIHPSVIMRKSAITKYLQNNKLVDLYNRDYIYAEDYKLWTDLALSGCIFANIQEVLLKYRVSEGQITSVYKTEMQSLTSKIQKDYLSSVLYHMIHHSDEFNKIIEDIIDLGNKKMLTSANSKYLIYSVYKCYLDWERRKST